MAKRVRTKKKKAKKGESTKGTEDTEQDEQIAEQVENVPEHQQGDHDGEPEEKPSNETGDDEQKQEDEEGEEEIESEQVDAGDGKVGEDKENEVMEEGSKPDRDDEDYVQGASLSQSGSDMSDVGDDDWEYVKGKKKRKGKKRKKAGRSKKETELKRVRNKRSKSRKSSIKSPEKSSEDTEEEDYEIQKIVGKRVDKKNGVTQYKIRWKGYSAKDDSWSDEHDMNARNLIHSYESELYRQKIQQEGDIWPSAYKLLLDASETDPPLVTGGELKQLSSRINNCDFEMGLAYRTAILSDGDASVGRFAKAVKLLLG